MIAAIPACHMYLNVVCKVFHRLESLNSSLILRTPSREKLIWAKVVCPRLNAEEKCKEIVV